MNHPAHLLRRGRRSRDPQGLLNGVRRSLRDDGVYLCLDMTAIEHLEAGFDTLRIISETPLESVYEIRPGD